MNVYQKVDYIGKKFGKLTVVGKLPKDKNVNYWECICECGKTIRSIGSNLKRGLSTSCGDGGCSKLLKNIKGKVFWGNLTAIEYVNNSKGTWIFKCICGKLFKSKQYRVKVGRAKSCGCKRRELSREKMMNDDRFYRKLFSRYKTQAKNRNIKFNVTLENLKPIFDSNCFYCDVKPYQKMIVNGKYRVETEFLLYNGIDRVDNKLGYEEGNLVSCCGECNQMKMDMDLKDFINRCGYIYKKHG